MRHRADVWTGENFFLPAFGVGLFRIFMRHRTNVWAGEDLLLPAIVILVRIVVRHRTNIGTVEDDLLATLAASMTAANRIVIAIPATTSAITRMDWPWSAVPNQDRFTMRRNDRGRTRSKEHWRRTMNHRPRVPRYVTHARTPAPAAPAEKYP